MVYKDEVSKSEEQGYRDKIGEYVERVMFNERELKLVVVRLQKMQQEHKNGVDTDSGFGKAVGLIDDLLALFE